MSRLILGTANFEQPYGIKYGGKVPKDETRKILETAIDNGIHMIDTSTAYIDSSAYPIKYIKRFEKPDDVFHYYRHWEMAHGFDKVDDEQWDGVSVDIPDEALKAAKMKMKVIEFPYNVFDHDILESKFFKLTEKNKITTIARSVFLQGLLLMDNPPIGKEYIEKLDNIIKPYGISRKEAIFLFTFDNPCIDYIVVGVDTAKQLQELINLTQYSIPWPLESAILDLKVPKEIKYPWLWK